MSENQTRNNRPLIIALIVIAVLLVCCCLVLAGLAFGGVLTWSWSDVSVPRVEATERVEETFEVSTPISLEVDVDVGGVAVHVGDGDEVRISGVKHAWGRDRRQAEDYLDDFEVRLRQSTSDAIEVESKTPRLRDVGRTPRVDLDIAVPRDAKLTVVVNVGTVVVTGVEGAFDIKTDVGDITLRDVRFEEDSSIRSDVGAIELRLPSDSAFSFSADSDVGDVRVDFPIRNERSDKRVVGGSIEGEIGDLPAAHVELRTDTGGIKIRRE